MELVKCKISSLSASKLLEVCLVYNANFPQSQWSHKFFDNYFANNSRRPCGIILYDKQKLIGFVWGRQAKTAPEAFNLAAAWINPSYRKNGLGALLINDFISEVKKYPFAEKIYLDFREQNKLSEYYAKFGFQSDPLVSYYKNGDLKHRMELALK